jgi:hypothetical protein
MQASARDPEIAVLEDDNGKNFCPLLCAPLVCRGVFRLLFSFLSCHRDSYSWILFGLSGFWRLEHLSPKERLFFLCLEENAVAYPVDTESSVS